MQRVEFTIEPFVEGRPGPHVSAPVDALTALGIGVDMGPFGSSCVVDDARVGEVVGTVTHVAVANGATRVHVDVVGEDVA